MNRITSNIDTGSAEYATNRSAYMADLAVLQERQQWAIDGGERRERSIQRHLDRGKICLLYTSPSPRDRQKSRMPSSA